MKKVCVAQELQLQRLLNQSFSLIGFKHFFSFFISLSFSLCLGACIYCARSRLEAFKSMHIKFQNIEVDG